MYGVGNMETYVVESHSRVCYEGKLERGLKERKYNTTMLTLFPGGDTILQVLISILCVEFHERRFADSAID